jgi:LuxR family transcriptional regulator, maltose regulon positive regulatory protein
MTKIMGLPTKYYIPAIPEGAISRPRLIKKINAGIKQKLVLVSAPAGFGKSTLVSQWVSQANMSVAWINLDRDDNNTKGFYYLIITAIIPLLDPLEESEQSWEEIFLSLPVEDVYALILEHLSKKETHITLVLDDYQNIESKSIQESMCYTIDHLPAQLHLIIISRTDPDLSMHCMRVKRQVTEIRTDELEFNHEEIETLFGTTYNFPLSEEEIESLEKRSEGWVACLQLAALSMQKLTPGEIKEFIDDFTSSNRHVWDYLIEEVYNLQPEAVRKFMLKTSILSQFNASLCNEVLGCANSAELIAQLEHSNLLVPMDNKRHWYRYPSLIAEFLLELFEKQAGMRGMRELHSRASYWFERMGVFPDAVNHAFGANEFEHAMRLLNKINESVDWKKHFTWQYNFLELPDDVLESEPEACLTCAWTFIYSGNMSGYERPLRMAERVWQASGNRAKLGKVYHLKALINRYYGHNEQAIPLAEKALEYLPEEDFTSRSGAKNVLGAAYLHIGRIKDAQEMLEHARNEFQEMGDFYSADIARACLARVQMALGQLHKAEATHKEVLQYEDPKLYDQVLAAYIFLGRIYLKQNHLTLAEKYIQKGINGVKGNNIGRYWPLAYQNLAKIWWEQGDLARASEALEKALSTAAHLENQPMINRIKADQARNAISTGDLDTAQAWIKEVDDLMEDNLKDYQRYYEWTTLIRLNFALAQKYNNPFLLTLSLKILDTLRIEAEINQRGDNLIEIIVLQSLAFWLLGDRHSALKRIDEALSRAEPENYVRVFIDEKEVMAQLLTCAVRNKIHPEYSNFLLSEYNKLPFNLPPFPTSVPSTPALLSNRELEILKCIAEGQSTQEIAQKLVLSQYTVRTHIKNLFEKLEAHNRIQAIDIAKARNLI